MKHNEPKGHSSQRTVFKQYLYSKSTLLVHNQYSQEPPSESILYVPPIGIDLFGSTGVFLTYTGYAPVGLKYYVPVPTKMH
jgi:hypothetical protein